jgi:hypothetical protein
MYSKLIKSISKNKHNNLKFVTQKVKKRNLCQGKKNLRERSFITFCKQGGYLQNF